MRGIIEKCSCPGRIRARSSALAQRVAVVHCVRMTIHNEVPLPRICFASFNIFSHEISLDTPYNALVISITDSDEPFEYRSRNGLFRYQKQVELSKQSGVHGSISKRRTLSLIYATDTGGSVTSRINGHSNHMITSQIIVESTLTRHRESV